MFDYSETEIEFVNFPETAIGMERAISMAPASMYEPPATIFIDQYINKGINMGAKEVQPVSFEVTQCPSKPMRLPTTHCYCNQANFSILKTELQYLLENTNDFDFSFDAEAYLWRGKLVHGARFLEVAVHCYWDSKLQDHLVSVRKVDGDAMHTSAGDLFERIERELTTDVFFSSSSASKPQSSSSSKKRRVMVPPSMPPTASQVQSGLQTVLNMARNELLDARVEASKMLCDLCTNKPATLLSEEGVQSIVLEVLRSLMDSENLDDARHFAVQTMWQLAQQQVYLTSFLHDEVLSTALLGFVRNASNYVMAYQSAAVRRRAAEVVVRMAHADSVVVQQLLVCKGGFSEQRQWLEYAAELKEPVLQAMAKEIAHCYNN